MGDEGTRFIRYHECRRKPEEATFQNIEWRNGVWVVAELRGGFWPTFVTIRKIEDNKCPWCKLDLPNLDASDE